MGADNAWQRWNEILERYREPDRLCGGGPLYRGENPQRVNAGSTGTDIPFPESGLVPCWFLYGVMGIEATREGLAIRPNLPEALPWLTVRNVSYRGLTLDVRVTPTSARVVSRTPGYRFTWKREFAEGESAVFVEPPDSVPGFPPVGEPEAASQTDAEWLWASAEPREHDSVYLRRTCNLDQKPRHATVDIAVDNSWELYVNGERVAEGQGWEEAKRVPVARFLRAGRNVIAVKATNADGPAGALVQIAIGRGGTRQVMVSNSDWRAAEEAAEGWADREFDDSDWGGALSFGKPPAPPWGAIRIPQ
jgi:hypothetical protein